MQLTYFLHAGTISWKLFESFWGWHGQKWVWLVMWCDFKIDCIWRMNRWNKLIFGILMQIHRFTNIKSWSKCFWVGIVKNGCGQSGHRTLILATSSILVFASWYKFRKAKGWFNDFWVGLVKDDRGLLFRNSTSRCILVPFEQYGCPKKCTQKISCNFFHIYFM